LPAFLRGKSAALLALEKRQRKGLEAADGTPLFVPYTPPYFPTMTAAVEAVVALKYGDHGIFRGGARHSAWKEPGRVAAAVESPSAAVIEATAAYCEAR
jgi:hypothetical protein